MYSPTLTPPLQQGPPFQKLPTLDPHHGPPPPQEGRAQVTTGFISGRKHEETEQRPETSILALLSCQGIKGRTGEALRKALSLLPRGKVAEECSEGCVCLETPSPTGMNVQGQELKSLGLAYEVSDLAGGERAQASHTGTRGYPDSKKTLSLLRQ